MDLRSLLDVEVSSIKGPSNWAGGQYHGFISKYEPGESREKKTPYLRVFVTYTRADESIPEDLLKDQDGAPLDMSKGPSGRGRYKDYYLTDDAKIQLVQLLQAVGIDTDGKKLSACVPELLNKRVLITLVQKARQDGEGFMNEIDKLVGDSDD